MKQPIFCSRCIVAMLLGAWLVLQNAPACAAGVEVSPTPSGQGDSTKTASTPDRHEEAHPEPPGGGGVKHSSGVDEILKMVKAGVSTEVIKAYIESSPTA